MSSAQDVSKDCWQEVGCRPPGGNVRYSAQPTAMSSPTKTANKRCLEVCSRCGEDGESGGVDDLYRRESQRNLPQFAEQDRIDAVSGNAEHTE